jgi:hypothetical protein
VEKELNGPQSQGSIDPSSGVTKLMIVSGQDALSILSEDSSGKVTQIITITGQKRSTYSEENAVINLVVECVKEWLWRQSDIWHHPESAFRSLEESQEEKMTNP